VLAKQPGRGFERTSQTTAAWSMSDIDSKPQAIAQRQESDPDSPPQATQNHRC